MLPLAGEWWTTACLSLLLALALPAALMPLLWRRGTALGGGAHVVVTGGSKGLGLALAKQCAAQGCSVTIVARNQADLVEALQQLQAAAAASPAAKSGAAGAAARLQALSADTGDTARVRTVACCLPLARQTAR